MYSNLKYLLFILILSICSITSAKQLEANLLVKKKGIYKLKVRKLIESGVSLTGKNIEDIILEQNGNTVPRVIIDAFGNKVNENKAISLSHSIEFILSNKPTSDNNIIQIFTATFPHESGTSINEISSIPNRAADNYPKFHYHSINVFNKKQFNDNSNSGTPFYEKDFTSVKGINRDFSTKVRLRNLYRDKMAGWKLSTQISTQSNLSENPKFTASINGLSKTRQFKNSKTSLYVLRKKSLLNHTTEIDFKLHGASKSKTINKLWINDTTLTYPRKYRPLGGQLDFVGRSPVYKVDNFNRNIRIYALRKDKLTRIVNSRRKKSVNNKYAHKFIGSTERKHYFISNINKLNKVNKITKAKIVAKNKTTSKAPKYVIISASQFVDNTSLKYLLNVRIKEHSTAEIFNVNDIYNKYSHGNVSTDAIDLFIKHKYLQGSKYFLLVGDTDNSNNKYGYTIPAPYVDNFHNSFVMSDAPYADTIGDEVADVALGRLPVKNSSELNSMIAKTLAYKNDNNLSIISGKKDSNWSFKQKLQQLSDELTSQSINLNEIHHEDKLSSITYKNQVANSLSNSDIVVYYGHGLRNGFIGSFNDKDLERLPYSRSPSILYGLACLLGSHHVDKHKNSMVKTLLTKSNRGSAAAVVNTGFVFNSNISQVFGRLILQNTKNGVTLGDIYLKTLQDYNKYRSLSQSKDIHRSMALLGDPGIIM